MEQNQHPERDTAAQEFHKSLHQLEEILQENLTEDEVVSELHPISESNFGEEDLGSIDLEALEEAVADIEQYLADIEQHLAEKKK